MMQTFTGFRVIVLYVSLWELAAPRFWISAEQRRQPESSGQRCPIHRGMHLLCGNINL